MVLIDDRVNVYHVVEVCVTKSLQSLNETYHSSFNLNYTLLSFLHYCVYLLFPLYICNFYTLLIFFPLFCMAFIVFLHCFSHYQDGTVMLERHCDMAA